jgi:hypothetical protein
VLSSRVKKRGERLAIMSVFLEGRVRIVGVGVGVVKSKDERQDKIVTNVKTKTRSSFTVTPTPSSIQQRNKYEGQEYIQG